MAESRTTHAAAEEGLEDVERVAAAAAAAHPLLERILAVLVVNVLFLRVAQHVVCLRNVLELRCAHITTITVLACQSALTPRLASLHHKYVAGVAVQTPPLPPCWSCRTARLATTTQSPPVGMCRDGRWQGGGEARGARLSSA
jgi:hypothetical protein